MKTTGTENANYGDKDCSNCGGGKECEKRENRVAQCIYNDMACWEPQGGEKND